MSLNIQTNSVMPQNNMTFRAKENMLIKGLRRKQMLDNGMRKEDIINYERAESSFWSFYEKLAKDLMSNLNVQQAKNTYK